METQTACCAHRSFPAQLLNHDHPRSSISPFLEHGYRGNGIAGSRAKRTVLEDAEGVSKDFAALSSYLFEDTWAGWRRFSTASYTCTLLPCRSLFPIYRVRNWVEAGRYTGRSVQDARTRCHISARSTHARSPTPPRLGIIRKWDLLHVTDYLYSFIFGDVRPSHR